MHYPGHKRAEENAEHWVASDGVHEDPHTRRILGRSERVEQDMQRQQHQAESDRNAADILDARAGTAAERHQSDNKQNRSDGSDIERQNLHDQRGADIGT